MNNLTLCKYLNEIKSLISKGDSLESIKKIESTIDKLIEDERKKDLKGSVRKAVNYITKISNRLKEKRPGLSLQSKYNYQGKNMYIFSDSFFLTLTNISFLEVYDDTKDVKYKPPCYDRIMDLVDIDDPLIIDPADIDFKKVQIDVKLKKEIYEIKFGNITKYIDPKYIELAYNLLEIDKNMKDIIIYTNSIKYGQIVFKNIKTNELVLTCCKRVNESV